MNNMFNDSWRLSTPGEERWYIFAAFKEGVINKSHNQPIYKKVMFLALA